MKNNTDTTFFLTIWIVMKFSTDTKGSQCNGERMCSYFIIHKLSGYEGIANDCFTLKKVH